MKFPSRVPHITRKPKALGFAVGLTWHPDFRFGEHYDNTYHWARAAVTDAVHSTGEILLYDNGEGEENWVPGFNQNEGSQGKQPDHLLACSGPGPNPNEHTWESLDPFDFSEIRTIRIEWASTGTGGVETYSVVSVGEQGESLFEGELIFFEEGNFAKAVVDIDVTDFDGTGHLKIHAYTDPGDGTTCVELYEVRLVEHPTTDTLPEVGSCDSSGYGLPEEEELAWLIFIDDLTETGENALVTPVCGEENFAVTITDNSPDQVIWMAEEQEAEQEHSSLISGWGAQALVVTDNGPVQVLYFADEEETGEHVASFPGWGTDDVILTNNTP